MLVRGDAIRFNFVAMLDEPTTLSSVARLIGDTLRDSYSTDPEPLYRRAGIDPKGFYTPGSRIPFGRMSRLWQMAVDASGDPWLGLIVGARARPADFYVLGHAWTSSGTLEGALRRLCRFRQVLSTQYSELVLEADGDELVLVERYREGAPQRHPAARDAGFAAFMRMIDLVTETPVRPRAVELTVDAGGQPGRYEPLFGCPVVFGSDHEAWRFAAAELALPLTGSVPEVAAATDLIAERYVASLDRSKVSSAVRQALVQLLPAGKSDQDSVAKRLYRSRSTLQRQLSAEGTSFREILDNTRLELARRYLQDGRYSQAQVAFMVGFSDQSNFARAFRRGTGQSPGQYQKSVHPEP